MAVRSSYNYKISADKLIHIHPSDSASFPYLLTHSHLLYISRLTSTSYSADFFGTLFDRDRPSTRPLYSLPSGAWVQLNRPPSGNRRTMAHLQPPAAATAPSVSLEPESFIDLGPDSPVLHPRAEPKTKAKRSLRIAVASTFTTMSACTSPSSDCSYSSASSSSSSLSASPPSLPCLIPLSPLSAFSFTLSPASESGTSYVQSDEDSDLDPDLDSDTEFETDDEGEDEDDSGDDSDTDVGDEESSFMKGYVEDIDGEDRNGDENENESEELISRSTNIHSHPYRYRLLPALSMPRFTPGPSSMYAPWPYTFKKGDVAFALTREGTRTWRRVTVLDNGLLSSFPPSTPRTPETCGPAKPSAMQSHPFCQSPDPVSKAINHYHAPPPSPTSPALVYTVQWSEPDPSSPARTRTMLGSFCPTRGNLKPDDKHTRRLLLLEEEGCTLFK
ncbi:hypothetical protein ACEPAH_46 [Sanghuangporus vaninii]